MSLGFKIAITGLIALCVLLVFAKAEDELGPFSEPFRFWVGLGFLASMAAFVLGIVLAVWQA